MQYVIKAKNIKGEVMAEKVLLKKYANWRLYDTEQSKYVTLTEVTQLIRNGRQVEVIDAKTKEDVTAFILTQILLEQAKNTRTGNTKISRVNFISERFITSN